MIRRLKAGSSSFASFRSPAGDCILSQVSSTSAAPLLSIGAIALSSIVATPFSQTIPSYSSSIASGR